MKASGAGSGRWRLVTAGALAAALVIASSLARAQVYTLAPPDLNARAERQLRALFVARTEPATRALFSDSFLICGPFLWRNVGKSGELEGKGIEFKVFTDTGTDPQHISLTGSASGRLFNQEPAIGTFRRAFLALYPSDTRARVRRLRITEARLLASMSPFPLKEPLFVVETGAHKFVVRFDDHLRIDWIDDYLHLP
jgi:hypothetical protein